MDLSLGCSLGQSSGNRLPPGAIFRTGPDGVDIIGLSSTDYEFLTADQQTFFFDNPSTPKTWATFALFWADIKDQTWLNQLNVFGLESLGVAVYDKDTGVATLTRALHYFRQDLPGYCTANALAAWTDNITDGTLVDDLATGIHEAIPAVSLKFSGAQHGSLASTVTIPGNFEIEFYTILSDDSTRRVFVGAINTTLIFMWDVTSINAWIGDDKYFFNTIVLAENVAYKINLRRISTTATLEALNIATGVSVSQTVLAVSTVAIQIKFVGAWSDGTVNRYLGYMWDLVVRDSSGTVVFQNYLATGVGTTAVSDVGPDVTLIGFNMPTDWKQSAIFGHNWNGSSGYLVADGSGEYNSGAMLSPAFYGVESGTLNTGSARQNIAVTGVIPLGGVWSAGDNEITLSIPKTPEMYDVYPDGFDVNGEVIPFDPYDFVCTDRLLIGTRGMIALEYVQTGVCATKTETGIGT